MTETTINKLRSYRGKVEAELNGDSWYVNPNEHPLPTLDLEYLEEEYLSQIIASQPELVEEASSLIEYIREHQTK